jgi:monooxygenase
METELDVLIVGSGLSGITAGYRLKSDRPGKRFLIMEARDRLGGTWDLFRYPGIRSDSDMYTFGFAFEPWQGEESVADGPAILKYIRDTARKYEIDCHIRYGHRVVRANWEPEDRCWRVEVETEDRKAVYVCQFLWVCSGYFSYQGGYQPDLPGQEDYSGLIVHPQEWPENLNYSGKKVVIVGSGATAVTLLPELAREAEHVWLLQRSPGFVAEVPRVDPWVARLKSFLPHQLAGWLLRWKGILYQSFLFRLARKFPTLMTKLLRRPLLAYFTKAEVEKHFTPNYRPWEQRLCVDTDGEYLSSLQSDRATILTDQIAGFEKKTVKLESGTQLEADILVTATGLVVELFGKIQMTVDGVKIQPQDHLLYKGAMLSDVPNMFFSLGYTNMSWTLKCDLTARYVCRLFTLMDKKGFRTCCPRLQDSQVRQVSLIDFSSGYLQRAMPFLPKQGSKAPWKLHQSYLADLIQTGIAPLEDGTMEFEQYTKKDIMKEGVS